MSDCCAAKPGTAGGGTAEAGHEAWFAKMIDHCLDYARAAKAAGRPIIGIMCEYTPREVIMAAGGVPVCLCGGSARMAEVAERELPSNLCPLIKSTYGYHLEHANPFLEMADLIVAETTCDGKKKMFELLAETRPVYVLELPQKPENAVSREHWRQEVARLKTVLEKRLGKFITDASLREAIQVMNSERALRRELAALMQADDPPLTGRQLLHYKSSISGLPADLAQYEQALAQLRARPATPRTGIRVLLTGVPLPHGAERVLEIIESCGGLVVCQENCTGLRPLVEDVDAGATDPLRAIADKYYHLACSVMTPNNARLELIKSLASDYRAECVIELVWQACLTYSVEAAAVKRCAEQELGIPYLQIQTDYAPADSARIAVRIEALFETIRDLPAGCRGR